MAQDICAYGLIVLVRFIIVIGGGGGVFIILARFEENFDVTYPIIFILG